MTGADLLTWDPDHVPCGLEPHREGRKRMREEEKEREREGGRERERRLMAAHALKQIGRASCRERV